MARNLSGEKMGNYTDGNTKTCGLFGYPVKHTMSPFIHNMLAELSGINMVYVPFEVEPKNLGDAVKGIDAVGIQGVNVTIPHKSEVIKYLAEVDELAGKIGAVNTLVKTKDGNGFKGYNTDMTGILRSLKKSGVTFKDASVIILGAGGVSRPVAYLCADGGAKEVFILNRTYQRAVDVAEEVNSSFGRELVKPMDIADYKNIPSDRKYLVFQCTSVGLYPASEEAVIMDENFYKLIDTAFDAVYRPVKTKFLRLAQENGAKALSGLEMLLFQAVDAFELWNNVKISDEQSDIVYKALERKISDKGNIILTGFMGCGKSTVSKALSTKTGAMLLDTDDMIVEKNGCSINEIFANKGENAFRDMETDCIKNLINEGCNNSVVAVGGGLPVRFENREFLKNLGKVVYLKTSVSEAYKRLEGDTTRPLLKGDDLINKIRNMLSDREMFYIDGADITVITDGKTPEEIADEIIRRLK